MTNSSQRLVIGSISDQHADKLRRADVELRIEPILYAEQILPGQVVQGALKPNDVALVTRAGGIVLWGEDERVATAEAPLFDLLQGAGTAVLCLSDAALREAAQAELEAQGLVVRVAPDALEQAMAGKRPDSAEILVACPTVPEAALIGPYVHVDWATEGRPEDGVYLRSLVVRLSDNLALRMSEVMERMAQDAAFAREARNLVREAGGDALSRHVASAIKALHAARRDRAASVAP